MRRNRFLALVCLCFFCALVATAVPKPGHCQTVTLTYSTFFPATHMHAKLSDAWGKEVEKRTNGKVKVTLFPGGTLTPPAQCYDGVVKGISDIGMGVMAYTTGRFPLIEAIELPLGYTSGRQATRLINAVYEKFKPKEFDDVKVMYLHAHGPAIIHTKTPVEKMEDLKGLKLRCPGTLARYITLLGGTPVARPQTETYDLLQKGAADGLSGPIEVLKGWKFAELIKFTTENYASSYSLGFFVVMNKKKWDALPKEAQQAIEAINKEWIEKTALAWDEIDKEGREYTLSRGNKIIKLSPEEDARWAKTVLPVLDDYVTRTKAKGLPAEEALKFCQEWLSKNK